MFRERRGAILLRHTFKTARFYFLSLTSSRDFNSIYNMFMTNSYNKDVADVCKGSLLIKLLKRNGDFDEQGDSANGQWIRERLEGIINSFKGDKSIGSYS